MDPVNRFERPPGTPRVSVGVAGCECGCGSRRRGGRSIGRSGPGLAGQPGGTGAGAAVGPHPSGVPLVDEAGFGRLEHAAEAGNLDGRTAQLDVVEGGRVEGGEFLDLHGQRLEPMFGCITRRGQEAQ